MKILASDFDKTLFTKDYLKNIRKINEFVDKGNIFIIVTGRNITHLKPDIKGYNLKYDYLICNDGGIIFDKNNKVIFRKDIDPSLVKTIYDILEEEENMIFVAIDNSIAYVNDTKDLANAIIGIPKDVEKAYNLLQDILNKFPNVHGYISDRWLNITNKEVNKGNSLKYIQKLLDVPNDDIYTIGDNINDISMNQLYNGYAMEHSHSELIKISKGTIKSVSDLIDVIYESNNN